MTIYTLTKLTEEDMELPELEVRNSYKSEDEAKEALVKWILELKEGDSDFADDLLYDENHEEDFDPENGPDEEYLRDWVKAAGSYHVYGNCNSHHFEITPTTLIG